MKDLRLPETRWFMRDDYSFLFTSAMLRLFVIGSATAAAETTLGLDLASSKRDKSELCLLVSISEETSETSVMVSMHY